MFYKFWWFLGVYKFLNFLNSLKFLKFALKFFDFTFLNSLNSLKFGAGWAGFGCSQGD